jgi:segregation and condensation protein A
MPVQEEYQVRLDAFCGPLDLLLYLIRQAEVDVIDIPIASVTNQYLGFLEREGITDVDAAAEFLVMAATLMEIKSRTLMPPEPGGGAGEGGPGPDATGAVTDPRGELIRQLLEYQKYRICAETLTEQREAYRHRIPRRPGRSAPPPEHPEPVLELEDAHPLDLAEAYQRIAAAIDFSRLGDHHVAIDDTPAAHYQQMLLEKVEEAGGRLALHEAFEGQSRLQRLGLFLATLELARLRRLVICQEDLLAEILLELNADPPEAETPEVETPRTPRA